MMLRCTMVMTLAFLLVFISGFDRPLASLAQPEQAGTIVYNKPNPFGLVDVWLINPDGSGDRRIPVNLVTAEFPVWSRDGQLIAATGEVPEAQEQASSNIFVFDATGAQLRKVTDFIVRRDPVGQVVENFVPFFKAFSPDGQQLAFVVFERVRGGVILAVVRLDGTGLTVVGAGPIEGFQGFGIDWSPTMNLLAVPVSTLDWSSGSPAQVTALFAVEPVNDAFQRGLLRQMTLPRGSLDVIVADVLPAFSPDGRQVAFVRRRNQAGIIPGLLTSSIRVINTDGTNEREVITFPPGEVVGRLSWSRDGTRLIFDRGRELIASGNPTGVPDPATMGLWMISLNGTGLRQIKSPPALSPSWNWIR